MSRVNLGDVPQHPNHVHKIALPDGVPQPPILGMFVAKRGQGKSTAAARLMKYYVEHNPPVFQKDYVFVISPTAESQYHLWDYIGIPDHNVFVAESPAQVKQIIDAILDLLKEAKQHYDDDQEYLKAYDKICQYGEMALTEREKSVLESRNCIQLENPAPWPRPMLILDDLSHMKVLDSKWFTSLCLRHRHVSGGVGLSMIIICQSLRGGLSRVVRQNASLICLWSTHDKTALQDLGDECGHLLERDEFEALFEAATEDFHSFMAVDMSQKDPNKVFSKEFQKWYQIRHTKTSEEQK